MPTLDQIDLVIREYYIISILLFIMGWMTYQLYKLSKKPSDEQLSIIKCNIQKAKQLHEKRRSKSKYFFISEKDELKSKFDAIISNYDRRHKLLQDEHSFLSAKMNVTLKKVYHLEFEKKFLQTKVDDLIEELMKRQSYDNVEKPKFF